MQISEFFNKINYASQVQKPVLPTKNREKVLQKRASSRILINPTPPNRRKFKINPPKHLSEDQKIDRKEEISVTNNENEDTKVNLYNLFRKKDINYDIKHNI